MDNLKSFCLYRLPSKDQGTFGVLVDEYPICVTLELPWKDNQHDKSCIPAGTYICNRVQSQHFGDVFQVENVAGRTEVLIHRGNTIGDIKGCIILGTSFGNISGVSAILQSGDAFKMFMDRLTGMNSFRLTIKDAA